MDGTVAVHQGCICRGVVGVEPPAKISDPPCCYLKKRKGGRLSMYPCISTVVDFNSQNFDPPLVKFDKYSPAVHRCDILLPV